MKEMWYIIRRRKKWGEEGPSTASEIYLEKMYGRVSFNFIYLLLNSFKLRGVLS